MPVPRSTRTSPSSRAWSATLLAVFVLLAAGLLPAAGAQAEENALTDFTRGSAARAWNAVNNGVMGGVSEGGAEVTDDGTLLFSGDLSLENNGGFASIRTRPTQLGLGGHDGVALRVRGDGRTYTFDLYPSERRRASSFRVDVPTTAGEWTERTVPFADFGFQSFGRRVPSGTLDPAGVVAMGFGLSDGTEGPFQLEIASVKAVNSGAGEDALGNLVEVATAAGGFGTLLAAVEAAGLFETLQNPDADLTVFAPTDEAFAALPEGTVASLLEPDNRDRLVEILTHHVVPGRLRVSRRVEPLGGGSLEMSAGAGPTVNDANIVSADIAASNGVLHVIDAVLLPRAPSRRPPERPAS